MKKRHLVVSIITVLIFGFLFSRDFLANLAWQKIHRPNMALILLNKDEKLAMQLGYYYFNGGAYDLKRGERAYKKALLTHTGILWGHYQLARIYFVKGEHEKALEEINKELAANPENLRSLYVRGLIHAYRHDLYDAEENFKRFILWAPKEWAGYNDLAWILSKQRKYKEAQETIKKALGEVPNAEKNPWLWNSLGVAELNLKEYATAKTSFEKAKALAGKLTLTDWQHSYPGNDPTQAALGLKSFSAAIEENLRRSQDVYKHSVD